MDIHSIELRFGHYVTTLDNFQATRKKGVSFKRRKTIDGWVIFLLYLFRSNNGV